MLLAMPGKRKEETHAIIESPSSGTTKLSGSSQVLDILLMGIVQALEMVTLSQLALSLQQN